MIGTDMGAMRAMMAGVEAAEDGEDRIAAEAKRAEEAQVSSWLGKIQEARDFDEEIRKGYARDRRYARGDTGFEVEVNLIGSFIDTLNGFIYAKDPDVSVTPSVRVQASSEEPPEMPQIGVAAASDPERAAMEYGYAMAAYEAEVAAWKERAAARKREREERMLFAATLEIVISKLWKKAKLKRRARRQVRSALTTSIGWLKVSWQEREMSDPATAVRIRDLKESVARIVKLRGELAEAGDSVEEYEGKEATLRDQMRALESSAEVTLQRGLAIDFVEAENIQVAPGVDILEFLDAAWVAERVFMRTEDARVVFADVPEEKWKRAQKYRQVKPRQVARGLGDAGEMVPERDVSAKEADKFTQATVDTTVTVAGSGDGVGVVAGKGDEFVSVWEIWDIESGVVRTACEGVKCWLRPASVPNAWSSRFYPWFALAFIEVDGERSPQSMVQRSWTLQNEYSRTRSNFAEHRRRSMPGVLFDETEIAPAEAKKLSGGTIQELTGIKTTSGKDLASCFAPKPVSGIDPILYDNTPVKSDLESIWGVQQALQGSVDTAKTATEAEIQQGGFQSRTGGMRDALEDMLGEMAKYSAEVLVQKLEPTDVMALAGPDAVWPKLDTPDELESLMDVTIRAGSSGKPITRADREAWAAVMPLLQSLIPVVGQMRRASEGEIADSLENLVDETLRRSGDSLDVTKFMPQTEGTNLAMNPMAAIQGMMGGDVAAIGGADAGAMSPVQPAATSGGITQE